MIRTYFWHDRVIGPLGVKALCVFPSRADRYFRTGNAGDIFARDLISHTYGIRATNVSDGGRRLLPVGSVAHKLMSGDVACGIGSKTGELASQAMSNVLVWGVRGPLTLAAFRKAGADLTNVKFLKDPGLLIGSIVNSNRRPVSNRIGFVAHYRERSHYRRNLDPRVTLIDIDAHPADVAEQILSCELVYSSSLHGIIFSHSLERPCVFVRPRTPEPLFKYEDYYLSVGLKMPPPLDEVDLSPNRSSPISPAGIAFNAQEISFPPLELLRERGICVTS